MTEQMHLTHRSDYLRGREDGKSDALAGRDYRPAGGDTDAQHACSLGYEDGWTEADPCTNGTCEHPAHRKFRYAVYERGAVVTGGLNHADAEAMAARLVAEGRNVYLANETS